MTGSACIGSRQGLKGRKNGWKFSQVCDASKRSETLNETWCDAMIKGIANEDGGRSQNLKEKSPRVRLQIKYRLFSLYVCFWAFHSSFLRVSERFCAFLSVPVLFSFYFFWISVSFLRVSARNDLILSARFFQRNKTLDRMIHFSFRFNAIFRKLAPLSSTSILLVGLLPVVSRVLEFYAMYIYILCTYM